MKLELTYHELNRVHEKVDIKMQSFRWKYGITPNCGKRVSSLREIGEIGDTFSTLSGLDSKGTQENVLFCLLGSERSISKTENLKKMNITFVIRCDMCKCSSEEVDRLLVCCKVVSLWRMVLNCSATQWVMPDTVRDVLHIWVGTSRIRTQRSWVVAPAALMWIV